MNLNIENHDELHRYLLQSHHVSPEEQLELQTLLGGVSSRTVLVRRTSGPAWVVKQSLPKLRVQMDWFSDPERVHREALGLRWLQRFVPRHVPQFVFEDFQQHLFAMTAVTQGHRNWKAVLLAGQVELFQVRQFGRLLGTIHGCGWTARAEVEPLFHDRGYFESLRVEPYYECSAALVPAAQPFLVQLIHDTRQRRLTLVHGDYSPKNVLVAKDQFILLDHEVIHFGDPAFDIGFALTHLLSKAHHLAACRDLLADSSRVFWESYCEALPDVPWRHDLESVAVRHTLACLLARTSGRSPLEYLSAAERDRQREAALKQMQRPPGNIVTLISEFLADL